MRKALLLTFGAAALAGCDFSGGSDAVAPISSLKASNLPAASGDADLFFELQDGTGRSYYRSAVQPGASTTEFSMAVSGSIEIPGTTAPLYVAVYDFEGGSALSSRLLARSTSFTAADLTASGLVLQDAPFMGAGDSEATFTVTRSGAAQ